jgi:hypothetical protein
MRDIKNLKEDQPPGALFIRYTLNGLSKSPINRHSFIHSFKKKKRKS